MKKNKSVDSTPKDEKKSGKAGALLIAVRGLLRLFFHSIFIPEFSRVNESLTKCYAITRDHSFVRIRRKTKLFQLVAFITPILITSFFIYAFYMESQVITGDFIVIRENVFRSIQFFKELNTELAINQLEEIKFSKKALTYLIVSSLLIMGNHLVFSLLWNFIVMANPLVSDSKKIKEQFVDRGWSKESDQHFLMTKAGILCQPSLADAKTIVEDKIFWRNIGRNPKEPEDYPNDKTLIFIGNGFELKKTEFKL